MTVVRREALVCGLAALCVVAIVGWRTLASGSHAGAAPSASAPSWQSVAPVAAPTALPTPMPDPTAAPFYEVTCLEQNWNTAVVWVGCTQRDNPLAASDVTRAHFQITNVPDGEDLSRDPSHSTYDFAVYFSVGARWQYLGTWHPWDGGGHNCDLGLDCAPPVFGAGNVRPGVYQIRVTYASERLAPYTLTITDA